MSFVEIIKAMSWYTVAKLVAILGSIAAIAVFTRLLTPDEFGQVAIYLSWVAMLTPLLSFGLSLSIPRSQIEFPSSLKAYALTLTIFAVAVFLAIISVLFIFNIDIQGIIGVNSILMMPLVFHILFVISGSIFIAAAQFGMEYKTVSAITLLKALGGLVLSYYFVVSAVDDPVLARVSGLLVTELLVAVYAFRILMKTSLRLVEYRYLKFGLVYSSPFILGSVSATINSQFDRVMLANMVSNSEAGIYSLGTSIGLLSFTVWVSLRQAIVPWVYRAYSNNSFYNIRYVYSFMGWLALLATIAGMLIAKEAIIILSSREYWGATTVAIFILCSSYIQILTLNETETQMYRKRTFINSLIIVVGAVVNVSVNYIYVPEYGYNAALCSTLISCLLMHILFYYYNKYSIGDVVTTRYGYILKITIAMTGALVVNMLSEYFIIRYILVFLVILVMYLYVKKNIGNIRRILN